MIQQVIWILAIVLVGALSYIINYYRFRKMIVIQTKQMIRLMKAEESDFAVINNIFDQADEDFADLERASLGLRKKYLRLRKQSYEERKGYETVFSGLKEAIVTVDQNLKIISFNASFLNFFKWIPVKEQPTYFLQDVIRDPSIIATFKQTFELATIQKSEIDDLQLFVTPLPSRLENETWCLGVFYDLSEIRKTEKIKVDFVANASHELRTPLTVIKGYSEILLNKLNQLGDSELRNLALPIYESAEGMSDLMDDLLSLSKLDLVSVLQKQVLSTKDLTNEILQETENLQQMKSKKVIVFDQAETVLANADAIKQVIRNLVVNAIKYSGDSTKIEIHWQKQPNVTVLKVKDFGFGISKEHQDRIFERFYRVDKGRGRDQGGTGLGLALVKHHVINHHGRIIVNSEPGKGSEFICEFPNNV
ncbi:MAG: ATP-binding protein [Pseudobdellovibrio sp.]